MFNKWLSKLKKHENVESIVFAIQSGDATLQNSFLSQYKPFVAKQVSTVCKRHISEHDDEFSVGLIAFDSAIQTFSADKGSSFLSFASVVIKNKVIDHIRKESRHSQNVSFDYDSNINEEQGESSFEISAAKSRFVQHSETLDRKEEILLLQKQLNDFGLTFKEISENAPKHSDARQNAIKIAVAIVENEHLKEQLLSKKRLPIKELLQYVDCSKKTVERNRKYIISIVLILLGDFTYLKDYLKEALS